MADDGSDTDDEGVDESDLLEFLDKRGAVEILATVDMDGVRFGHLDESLGISHDTISKYLQMAEDLDLVEPKHIRGERGVTHEYVLTRFGARIHRELKMMGAVDDFRLLQMYRRRVPEYEEKIKQWVREREGAGDLHDRKRNLTAYESLKQGFDNSGNSQDEER